MKLGERIQYARSVKKLTQGELAKLLSVTFATVNRYEKGHRTPDADFLGNLVENLGCNPAWLLMGKGSAFSPLAGGGKTFKEMSNIADLGGRIRFARCNLNLGQKELADRLGVRKTTLEALENNKKQPDPELSDKLVLALEVNPGWLFFADEDIYFPGKLILLDPSRQYGQLTCDILHLVEKMDDDKKQELLKYIQKECLLERLLREHAGE